MCSLVAGTTWFQRRLAFATRSPYGLGSGPGAPVGTSLAQTSPQPAWPVTCNLFSLACFSIPAILTVARNLCPFTPKKQLASGEGREGGGEKMFVAARLLSCAAQRTGISAHLGSNPVSHQWPQAVTGSPDPWVVWLHLHFHPLSIHRQRQ